VLAISLSNLNAAGASLKNVNAFSDSAKNLCFPEQKQLLNRVKI
jgi:hypothetical protein